MPQRNGDCCFLSVAGGRVLQPPGGSGQTPMRLEIRSPSVDPTAPLDRYARSEPRFLFYIQRGADMCPEKLTSISQQPLNLQNRFYNHLKALLMPFDR